MTKDHVYISKKEIKKNKLGVVHANMLLACNYCNSVRGDSIPDTNQKIKARMLHISAVALIIAIGCNSYVTHRRFNSEYRRNQRSDYGDASVCGREAV